MRAARGFGSLPARIHPSVHSAPVAIRHEFNHGGGLAESAKFPIAVFKS